MSEISQSQTDTSTSATHLPKNVHQKNIDELRLWIKKNIRSILLLIIFILLVVHFIAIEYQLLDGLIASVLGIVNYVYWHFKGNIPKFELSQPNIRIVSLVFTLTLLGICVGLTLTVVSDIVGKNNKHSGVVNNVESSETPRTANSIVFSPDETFPVDTNTTVITLTPFSSHRSFNLKLTRDRDLMTIYIDPLGQPLNLSDLQLKAIKPEEEIIILLNSKPSFSGVLENVNSPICLILSGANNNSPIPDDCSRLNTNNRFESEMIGTDVFWFEDNGNVEHALTVLLGDEVIKACGTQSQCEITYPPTIPPTPLPTPIPTPIVGNILSGTYPTSASGNVTLTGFAIDLSPVNNTDFGYFINAVTDETGTYSWEKGMDWWPPNAEEWVEANAPRPLGQRETERDIRRIITWYEAAGYCKWRGGQLPTAEEWEIAYRQNVLNTEVPIEWINPEFNQIISVSPSSDTPNFSVFEIPAEGTPLSGQASFRCVYKNPID